MAAAIFATLRTRDLCNPVNLISIGFFANMLLASLRLSPLQRDAWSWPTRVILAQTWVLWFAVPVLIVGLLAGRDKWTASVTRAAVVRRGAVLLIRVLAVACVGLYLVESYVFSGRVLPFTDPTVDMHTQFTTGLGIVTRGAIGGVGIASLVVFLVGRRRLDLVLSATVLILPITRLNRFDFFFLGASYAILVYYFNTRSNRRFLAITAIVLVVSVSLLVGVSFYRHTEGGVFESTYPIAVGIGNGETVFDEVVAHYYGYFALSFDSFDNLVRASFGRDVHTYGLYTFRPVTVALFRVHNFWRDYPDWRYFVELSDPALGAEAIATALGYPYVDFGVWFIWVYLLIHVSLFLMVFLNRRQSILLTVVYSVIGAAFLLASWTDELSSPRTYYCLLPAVVLTAAALDSFGLQTGRGLSLRWRATPSSSDGQ